MFWSYLSVSVMMITGILLIFIILLQRGRGGGLAGAFGGAGGQSALGTKAGDVFTRITIGLAVVWVIFACISIYTMRAATNSRVGGLAGSPDDAALAPASAAAEDEDLPGAKPKPATAPAEKPDTAAPTTAESKTATPPGEKEPAGSQNP